MARLVERGLRRTVGVPGLFGTAYGNVGSSIYYALGVTAVFALGLTPLVFLIAGVIFAATTLTYAEGTVRFPEAGGSSSRRGSTKRVSPPGGRSASTGRERSPNGLWSDRSSRPLCSDGPRQRPAKKVRAGVEIPLNELA